MILKTVQRFFFLCLLSFSQEDFAMKASQEDTGHIHVAVEIIDFKIPSGIGFSHNSTRSGRTCNEGGNSTTGNTCEIKFSLCVGSVTGQRFGDCAGLLVNSTELLNNTSPVRDAAYTSVNFPFFSLNSWDSKEEITVYVMKEDPLNNNNNKTSKSWELLDVLTNDIEADVDKDFWTSKRHLATLTKCAREVLRVIFSGSCTRRYLGQLIHESVTDMQVQHALNFMTEPEIRDYFGNLVERNAETETTAKGQFNLRFRLLGFHIPSYTNSTDICKNEFRFSYGNNTIAQWNMSEDSSRDCFGDLVNVGQSAAVPCSSSFRHISHKQAVINKRLTLEILRNGSDTCRKKLATLSFDVVEETNSTSQPLIVTGINYKHVSSFILKKNDSLTGVSVTLEMMVWCSNGFESSTSAGLCEKPCDSSSQDCNMFKCYSGGRNPYRFGYTCTSKGVCTNATCNCRPGYVGPKCRANVDECQLGWTENRCNRGTCVDGTGNFSCHCPADYTGRYCETKIKPSVIFPNNNRSVQVILKESSSKIQQTGQTQFQCIGGTSCVNGTSVQNDNVTYCYCDYGFKGTDCQELDYCASKPCQNGGKCISTDTNFSCNCADGFHGLMCASITKCLENDCENNATVFNSTLPGHYVCLCQEGFVEQKCEIKVCRNGGNQLDSGFECTRLSPGNHTGITCNELKNTVNSSKNMFSILLPAPQPDNVDSNNMTEGIISILSNVTEHCNRVQLLVNVIDHGNGSTSFLIGVICDGHLMPSRTIDHLFGKQPTNSIIKILHLTPTDEIVHATSDKMWIEEYWIIVLGITTGIIASAIGALKAVHIVYRTKKHTEIDAIKNKKSSSEANRYVSFRSVFANKSNKMRYSDDLSNELHVPGVSHSYKTGSVSVLPSNHEVFFQPDRYQELLKSTYKFSSRTEQY